MESGPHINAAVFCDSALIGNDGALSLIRIIDTVTQTTTGDDPPEQMPAFVMDTKLVISVKAGEARGRYKIKLRPEAPDGRHMRTEDYAIQLEGGHSGVNLITDVHIRLELEGIYWFDILFVAAPGNERLLTRVPLRVLYQPQKTGS